MSYKYKSESISFLDDTIKVRNLCVYNDLYYFESDAEIEQAEIVPDEEFAEAVGSVVHVESFEPVEPQPTQLDRIESMVAKSQEEIAQEARDAYTLELIEGGIIA